MKDNTASAIATGGTPSYGYLWIDDTADSAFTIEWPGSFEVTVTDSNGCDNTYMFLGEGIANIVWVWKMVIFEDDIPVGEYSNYYSEECPNIIINKTSSSGTIEFTPDNLFYYSWTDHTIVTHIQFNANRGIVEDKPDTDYYTPKKGNGSYYYDGTQFILFYFDRNEETV